MDKMLKYDTECAFRKKFLGQENAIAYKMFRFTWGAIAF